MQFKDYFSKQASQYREFRPHYPPELFAYLAGLTKHHDLAWDCATGNGQAALGLAPYYAQVIATDASRAQLEQATQDPKIRYKLLPAEQTDIASSSVDLVTVAQALHWFDFDRFFAEVRRVARPDAVIAIWGYSLMKFGVPALDGLVAHFYDDVLWKGGYWPEQRRYLDEEYDTIPFPFAALTPPVITLRVKWNFERFLQYLGTWSAVQKFRDSKGFDPVAHHLREALFQAWGEPSEPRELSTDLLMRVGRVNASRSE